jgi:hypothetical protein
MADTPRVKRKESFGQRKDCEGRGSGVPAASWLQVTGLRNPPLHWRLHFAAAGVKSGVAFRGF